jgi:hypothetical protein
MRDSESDELERILIEQLGFLREDLTRGDWFTSGRHGRVATQLRLLLCDKDLPVFVRYAAKKTVNVQVYGPVQYPERHRKHMALHFNTQVIGRAPFVGSQAYDLPSYLNSTIQVLPVRAFNDAKPGDDFTPRNLITWVANKEGFAHLELKKPKPLAGLKTLTWTDGHTEIKEFTIKDNLRQVGAWVAEVIPELLRCSPGTKLI